MAHRSSRTRALGPIRPLALCALSLACGGGTAPGDGTESGSEREAAGGSSGGSSRDAAPTAGANATGGGAALEPTAGTQSSSPLEPTAPQQPEQVDASAPVSDEPAAPVPPSTYPCPYEGEIYQPGDVYPAADGCNLCTCSDDGESSCTKNGCLLDPDQCAPASLDSWSIGAERAVTLSGPGTVVCVLEERPGRICFHGTVADAGDSSANGTGGVALLFSGSGENAPDAPFDPIALGAVGLRFGVYGLFDIKLRPSLAMRNDPSIAADANNFEENPFVSSVRPEISTSGTWELRFADMEQPEWSQLDVDGDGTVDRETPFDPNIIDTFRLLVLPEPGREAYFEMCLDDVEWIDEKGRPIRL